MTQKLERKIGRWKDNQIMNYRIKCCDNLDYLISLRRAVYRSYDLSNREKGRYYARIDGIMRRQLNRMRTKEYLEMLEK